MTGLRTPLSRLAVAAALLSALAGCSDHAAPPSEAAVAPAYAAVARGQVAVEGGLLQLSAPRDGTLASVDVHEGDTVRQGQALATMDVASARFAVQAADAGLQQAQADAQWIDGKLALARVQARRLDAAAKAGAGDGQSADAARGTVDELTARKVAADAAIAVAREKRGAARYELGLRTLRAPIDARVTQVDAQPGASVTPQSGALFTLLPATPPIVRAELSAAMVDAVKVGMPATVSTDGSGSDRRWPAHVLRIGSVVGPSTLEDDPQQRLNARTVSCVLAFDQPQALRIGERVLVRFGGPVVPAVPARKPLEKR